MNGTSGHCVVLDLFRRVIIDPAEKWEVDLEKFHLLKYACPILVCIEFKHVIEIKAIKGVAVGNLNNDLRNRLKERAVEAGNLNTDERKRLKKRLKKKGQREWKRKRESEEKN